MQRSIWGGCSAGFTGKRLNRLGPNMNVWQPQGDVCTCGWLLFSPRTLLISQCCILCWWATLPVSIPSSAGPVRSCLKATRLPAAVFAPQLLYHRTAVSLSFYAHLFTCHQEEAWRSFFLNAVVFPRLRTAPKMGHRSVSVGCLFDTSPKTTTQLSSFTSGAVRSKCFLFMIQNDDAALFLSPSVPSQWQCQNSLKGRKDRQTL